jgi:deoxyribodipyrimidine photo-lyase
LRQLGWREFAYDVLFNNPDCLENPLRQLYVKFEWRHDPDSLYAWERGETGYPLVDAGMRQLAAVGWMPNRVRMSAASFLVKHLLVSWQAGAQWFWKRLMDADLANNVMGWQWVAGCGFDAAPYFRIFNPVLQGERFDPRGTYVKRWVPELANLDGQFVHKPWTASETTLRRAGLALGHDYPWPIIGHEFARKRALGAWSRMRKHQGAEK